MSLLHRPNRFAPTPAAATPSRRLERSEEANEAAEALLTDLPGEASSERRRRLEDRLRTALFDWRRTRSDEER